MASNISKYIQLNSHILLEYEFNKSEESTDLTSLENNVGVTLTGSKVYWNTNGNGITNNTLLLNSVPLNNQRTKWYINPLDTASYLDYFDPSTLKTITQDSYPLDTIKLHIVSGYNYDDVAGCLLQISAQNNNNELVNLANFTWAKQLLGGDVIKFSSNALYLNGKFYDKYILLRIPSIQYLGGNTLDNLGVELDIKPLSDVYINYSTILTIDNTTYFTNENIQTQLPVTSVADNFNVFIAESTSGDYIEFYATWKDVIIGEYMTDIENGRIRLYTSNNPNDNYEEFIANYGLGNAKWVLLHDLYVYENLAGAEGGSSLLAQKLSFTQSDTFNTPNYFRPVLPNADIDASYTIQYVCRLVNRMDGSQIIRQASFASKDPKKFGRNLNRINVENFIPYKVINKIANDKANVTLSNNNNVTKFVKVFTDTTNIALDQNNEIYPQGTGPLFLKNGDAVYNFQFKKYVTDTKGNLQKQNIDLSGAYKYGILFTLDNKNKIIIYPTYSENMNTAIGKLEFKINDIQTQQLLNQSGNTYSIVIENPDGTYYTYYQGLYYPYSDITAVSSQYNSIFTSAYNTKITELNNKISELEKQIQTLNS